MVHQAAQLRVALTVGDSLAEAVEVVAEAAGRSLALHLNVSVLPIFVWNVLTNNSTLYNIEL